MDDIIFHQSGHENKFEGQDFWNFHEGTSWRDNRYVRRRDILDCEESVCTTSIRETREDAEQLDEARKEIFHTVTRQLLYIKKRARLDIETAISFLTTWVDKGNIDDWKKLKRVIQYFKQTIDDVRVIGYHDLKSL